MYSTLFTTTLFFALAAIRVRADFTVYTPTLTQCQPATLTWDPATGPYDVLVVSSADPCGDAIDDFGNAIGDTSYQWSQVNIPAGTQVTISVVDSTGAEGWSGSVTVQPNDDSSCLSSQNSSQNTPSQNTPDQNTPSQNTPDQNTPNQNTPSPSPSPPAYSPNAQNPTPSSSSPSSNLPTPTVVGAANNGILGNGGSMVRFSSVAVVVTALGALAALL